MPVRITKWQGVCGLCGEPPPEERDTEEEARQDADECPCRDEPAEEGTHG